MVAYFARNTAPSGWLKANGAAVSRTTYAALFAAIGTTFGAGDGSTTFNLPDLRAEFIRGWDDGRGVDSGRAFGTWQGDQFGSHTHNVKATTGNAGVNTATNAPADSAQAQVATSAAGGTSNGNETRPRNVALLACIKY
jgi:phage-related tail fiber protein